MSSIKGFLTEIFKKLNCGTLALIMLINGLMMCFSAENGYWGLMIQLYGIILWFVLEIWAELGNVFLYIVFSVQVILNIACFLAVKNNKKSAIPIAVLGGCFGGAVSANTVNKKFAERRAINMIFVAELFLFVIYPVLAFFIYVLLTDF